MKERLKEALKVILMLGVPIIFITCLYVYEGRAGTHNKEIAQDTIQAPQPVFMDKSAEEGLKDALVFYDIKHPEIVYAQAVLETGHFKSYGCLRDNNLFGLYNSYAKRYHKFNHWSESVVAYKKWIQRRYKPPENYYSFLKRINYASDPQYITKLKSIVESENRRSKRGSTQEGTVTQG